MKNSNLTICDATIHPGETANLALPLPDFYSCTSFYMPITVVHGKLAGPCLLIFSTVKGDELNGLEIINRLLGSSELQHLRGTLIIVPVLNVLGLLSPSRTTTHDVSLERCFPGNPQGSYNERLAHIFTQKILCKVSHCIELQTGSLNHELLPQVFCNFNHIEAKQLARQFSAPVVTSLDTSKHSLRQTIEQLNIPLLVYLAGEAMRFNESAIRVGLSGVHNILCALDMLDRCLEETKAFNPIFSQEQDWFRAHRSGVLFSEVELGQKIRKGQHIGRIVDPFSSDTSETVKSNQDGVVVGINRHPLIHEGQTIFKVASFIDNNHAETALEAWGDSLAEMV